MSEARVAVIGAGFSGLLLSIALARLGFEVDVYEEHTGPGVPPHCTGIISRNTLSLIEYIAGPLPGSLIAQKFDGVTICSQGYCRAFKVLGGLIRLDRPGLDRHLASIAARLDVRIHLKTKVTSVAPDGKLKASNSVKAYDYVIIAEGARPRLRVELGVGCLEEPAYGVNYITTLNPCRLGRYEPRTTPLVAFERLESPGYLWAFRDDSHCIVGIASHSTRDIRRLLNTLRGSLKGAYGGPIYIGHTVRPRLRRGRVTVFGDAACLNKPLSGGGLYPQALAVKRLLDSARNRSLARALTDSVRSVHRTLEASAHLSRLALRRPKLVKCILESIKDRLGPIEYDNYRRTASQVLSFTRKASLFSCDTIGSVMGVIALLRGALESTLNPSLVSHFIRPRG